MGERERMIVKGSCELETKMRNNVVERGFERNDRGTFGKIGFLAEKKNLYERIKKNVRLSVLIG